MPMYDSLSKNDTLGDLDHFWNDFDSSWTVTMAMSESRIRWHSSLSLFETGFPSSKKARFWTNFTSDLG